VKGKTPTLLGFLERASLDRWTFLLVYLRFRTVDKVQKPINSECCTPSSESFRFFLADLFTRLLVFSVLGSYNDSGPSSDLVVNAGGFFHHPSTFFLGYSNDPWGTSATLLQAETTATQTAKRSKRGVVHLYNMVLCATGCDPLAFKGYGCYCGFLGSGYTVDGIDR
jgi:hypothetical protein